jgi:hypothetical protein
VVTAAIMITFNGSRGHNNNHDIVAIAVVTEQSLQYSWLAVATIAIIIQ